MKYEIKMLTKADNQYVSKAHYSLPEKVFSFWIQVHQKQGFDVKKIDTNKLLLHKKDRNLYFVCTKQQAA